MKLLTLVLVMLAICAPVISAPASEGRVDPVKVKNELAQILSSPEYNRSYAQNPLEKALTTLGKNIVNAIKRAFMWLADHLTFDDPTGVGIISRIGAWMAVLGFLALVAFVIWKLLGNASGQTPKDALDDNVIYEMPPAKQLIRQAAKLAEAGDYRTAFKTAYLASIAYLDEIHALRFERSRTNWEYLRELKQGGREKPHGVLRQAQDAPRQAHDGLRQAHDELQPLTIDFDRKIYGREDCVEEDYLNAAAVYDRLSQEETK